MCCGKLRCIDSFNCCRPIKDQDDTTQAPIFDTPKFLFNRLSRILPVFYMCFIMAIVLTPTGHGNQVKNVSFPGCQTSRVTEITFAEAWDGCGYHHCQHWVCVSGQRLVFGILHSQWALMDSVYTIFLLRHFPHQPSHGSGVVTSKKYAIFLWKAW